MELDGKQRGMLRVGLAAAFFDYEKLRRFLINTFDFDLNQHTHAGQGLETVYDVVIDNAMSDGWVDALLDSCAAHTNPKLKSVATLIQQQLVKSRPIFYNALRQDPFSALFLGKEQCFIGRDLLRLELKEMQSDQEERRVLVVNGGNQLTTCGKSYTYGLLRLLDRLEKENIVVKIDFREFREGDLESRYRDIIEKINSRMRVPADEMPKLNESQTRWFQNAIDKFEIIARENGKKLWLVFDHIGAREIDEKIADALASTAVYTINEASSLRVILIDVDPTQLKLEIPIFRKLRSDAAVLPVKEDVVDFLKRAREMSGRIAVTDESINIAATNIIASIAGLDEPTRAYEYSRFTWNSAVQLGLVQ